MKKESNLLNLKEIHLKAISVKMLWVMSSAVVGAIVCVALAQTWVSSQVERQISREAYLKAEITLLDAQIKEIADIQERTAVLLGRKKVIERLQFNRGQAVVVLNELINRIPEGVQLRQIDQNGETLKVVGWATSNASISAFMKAMEEAPAVETPTLIEIKAVLPDNKGSQKVQEFTISMKITNERIAKAKEAKDNSSIKEKGAK
jgi:type IV pilus assembly protein PilN